VSQCWSHSKQKQRCEQDAGHEGDHTITYAWMDGDSYDPIVDIPVPFVPATMGGSVHTVNTLEPASGGAGRCFSCNCTEGEHIPGVGCEAHSCRSFVP